MNSGVIILKTYLTMLQKIKLTHFLHIGISIFLITVVLHGCKKTDSGVNCQYRYVNKSNYQINMKIYNNINNLINEYNININDSIIINLYGEGGAGPFQYSTDESQQGDSVSIIFSQQRFLFYLKGNGILYENNYTKSKDSDTKIILHYYFENKDYDLATPLK